MSNICVVIDHMHISLVEKTSRKYVLIVLDYYTRIFFHNIVVQAIPDVENFFGMFVLINLEEFTMGSIQKF